MTKNSQERYKSAGDLFQAGNFAEAEKVLREVVEDDAHFGAYLLLGYLALIANRLDEALRWLSEALELKPNDPSPKSLIAEIFYRQDNFQQAAPLFYALGRDAMAEKLESFQNVLPYLVEGHVETTHIKFVVTDPLPVVQICVNGSTPVNFFIDTGGAEIILDSEFAKEVGARKFGSEVGTFAGGQQTGVQHGRVDTLALNKLVIKNIPVNIMDIRRLSQSFGGRRIDGILGTVLLYHFLSTIDYPKGELVLRPKTMKALQDFEQNAHEQPCAIVPFWMAGDHYMVSWGTINQGRPMLLFVDTGLIGGAFTCPESTLKEAGIELEQGLTYEGLGGAGLVKETPFALRELTFGSVKEQNLQGVFMGPFPLENACGFRIGGLISHSFFRRYALTLDFLGMRYFLQRGE
jgi:tetratricopeptide (TPR) repeat protein